MSAFWVVAAALTLAVIGVLAVPLMRREASRPTAEQDRSNIALFRDQLAELERDRAQGLLSDDQFEQARVELGRRLLSDVASDAAPSVARQAGAWRYAVLACVPIAAVLAYLALGTPQALDPAALSAKADSADRRAQLAQLTERLAARVRDNPDDPEAVILLARSLQLLGRAPEAVKAFARAIKLVPDSAQLHADYADVLVSAAHGEWTPAASAALAKALELDPSHPKALWLAGTEAYARKDYRSALAHWEKLVPMTEPGTEVRHIVEQNIAEVRRLAAAQSTAPPVPGEEADKRAQAPAGTAAHAVSGTVTLDPALAGEVKPDDTVFVFARAATGPKMPLAIRRIRAGDLPYQFALDDSAAMAPGMTISAFPQVVIGARVSRTGNATAKPGDLQGFSTAVKPGTQNVEVRIDARVR